MSSDNVCCSKLIKTHLIKKWIQPIACILNSTLITQLQQLMLFRNRNSEGCTSPQVSSAAFFHHFLCPYDLFYFCHSRVSQVTVFGHFAGFTVTASTDVWFVANWGKWADGIHQDVVPVLRRCPGCRVYFSFVIGRVARLILCWLMAQHPPTCFSPTDGWNLCVSALLEDIIVHNRWHLWWMIVFLCWFSARNWNAIFNLFHENGLF